MAAIKPPPQPASKIYASRRLLQLAVMAGTIVPVTAGLAGVIMGPAMLGDGGASTISMDSHYRYLSGLLTGIGLGFWSTVPAIETKTARFRLLSLLIVTGGIARLYALITVGRPDPAMLFGLGMELVIVPTLVVWQTIVADKTETRPENI